MSMRCVCTPVNMRAILDHAQKSPSCSRAEALCVRMAISEISTNLINKHHTLSPMEDSQIWTEKYRPKTFSDVKGQKEIVQRIRHFVEQKNMPHVLFAGPAGVGKTSLALVIARQLFGDSWRQN